MSTYMTLEEYVATLKIGDTVVITYYSMAGDRDIKEKILKITKSGTIYLRSTNCKDAIRFRKNGHWLTKKAWHVECSECHHVLEFICDVKKYCPNCGAKMEGE